MVVGSVQIFVQLDNEALEERRELPLRFVGVIGDVLGVLHKIKQSEI